MLYTGTVLLKMTESEFWACTPRKLSALFNQYIKHQKIINGVTDEDTVTEADTAQLNKNSIEQLQALSRR